MRLAKLEITLLMAMWIALFEYELVDELGKRTSKLPTIDMNAAMAHEPSNARYLRYWQRGGGNPKR
jgi:hypothetical protein